MSEAITIRTRKFMPNPLLKRRQFILDVFHPGKANVSKAILKEKLAGLFKVAEADCIFLFGFKTAFGGGKSTGFALIYNDIAAAKRFEPKYRQIRQGFESKVERSRKQLKEGKNKAKKTFGTGRRKAARMAKKNAED